MPRTTRTSPDSRKRADARHASSKTARNSQVVAKNQRASKNRLIESTGAPEAQRPTSLYARIGQLVGEKVDSEMDLVVIVRAGLPATSVHALKEGLGHFDTELIAPETTLRRRLQDNKSLTVDESERMIRVARITALAEQLWGDRGTAHQWLNAPGKFVRDAAPISPVALAATDPGARLIETILLRIEHGLF